MSLTMGTTMTTISKDINYYNFSILTYYPTGLNGHPVVEELCQFLEENQNQSPFFLAFLVDKMEETMQSDASSSQSLLPKADQVRKKCLV